MPARMASGVAGSPNPGKASDLKPRSGYVTINGWAHGISAGGLLAVSSGKKQRGGGGGELCFVLTPPACNALILIVILDILLS